MPYIPEEDRQGLTGPRPPSSPGERNYLMTKAISDYLMEVGLSYANLHFVTEQLNSARVGGAVQMGTQGRDLQRALSGLQVRSPEYNAVIDMVQAEYYRRIVGPYEDQAIERNNDVYDPCLLS